MSSHKNLTFYYKGFEIIMSEGKKFSIYKNNHIGRILVGEIEDDIHIHQFTVKYKNFFGKLNAEFIPQCG